MSANKENLIPFRNEEEARAKGRKGGVASGIARRRKKTLKEELEILLELCDKKGITNQEKMSLALIEKAKKGDTKAFEVVRTTIGQDMVNKFQIEQIPIIKDDIK